eukprot:COSAG05_NODE_1984_length_3746_cov_3.101430_1_plen_305_part_10
MRIATFNCGNAPPADLTDLLVTRPDGISDTTTPDLIVLGLQESAIDTSNIKAGGLLKMKTTVKSLGGVDGSSKQIFVDAAEACLGAGYTLMASAELGEIRLLVWARSALAMSGQVSEVETATEATGVGGVVGNKGGVCAKLKVRGTSLCFFNTHLAAHEGTKKAAKRNSDIEEIFEGARVGPLKWMDAATQFDHCFFMGDMNYRMDLRQSDGIERSHEKHWQDVKSKIDAGDFDKLLPGDQLCQELAARRVLVGFTEGPLAYAPTFKVERKEGTHYVAKRIPSYTDRILWRSLPGLVGSHRQEWV